MKNIKKILEPFNLSFGKKQDIGIFLTHLRNKGVSPDEVIDYIEGLKKRSREAQKKEIKKQSKEQDRWNKIALKCSNCKAIMQLFSVNNHPSNQVGEGLNSQWFCPKCWHDKYSEKTVSQVIVRLSNQLLDQ